MSTCAEPIRLVPGPSGPSGSDGADGTNGTPSSTSLTAAFTMPAIGLTGNAIVSDSSWAIIGEPSYLQNAGTLLVTAVPNSTTITLRNPSGYALNVAGGTIVAIGNKLGPSGFIGPAGTNGSPGAGSTVSLQGDLQTHDGTNPVSQSVGTNKQTLHADSTSSTGLDWRAIDLTGAATDLTGSLPIANGGTGAATAVAAATNLAVLPLSGGTLTGPLLESGTTPEYKIQETDAGANETRWAARADGGDFKLQAVNDAETVRIDALAITRTGTVVDLITLAATQLSLANSVLAGNTYIPTATIALVNGVNSDIAIGTGTFFRITGPSAVFSISGIAGGAVNGVGRLLILYNTVAFDLTITNNATSTSANRILTLTGADVTLTGICSVRLLYDVTEARWILLGTQG